MQWCRNIWSIIDKACINRKTCKQVSGNTIHFQKYHTRFFGESMKRLPIWLLFPFLSDSSISGFFNSFIAYIKSRIPRRNMIMKKQAISKVSRVKIPTLLIEKHTLITLRILTKLPPCTLLFGTASLSIFLNF